MNTKKLFEEQRNGLRNQIQSTLQAKAAAETKMNQLQIEVQRINRGIIAIDSKTANQKNLRARVDEILVAKQTEVNEANQLIAEAQKRFEVAKNQAAESTSKLKDIRREIGESRRQYDDTQKKLLGVSNVFAKNRNQAINETKLLEQQTLENNAVRTSLAAVLSTSLALAKQRNESSHLKLSEERSAVLESKVSVERSQTEIAKLQGDDKKEKLESDTMKVKMRTLASIAVQSDLNDEPVKMWVMTKNCYMRAEADTDSTKKELVKKEKTFAGQVSGTFVKALNSSGHPLYMPMGCVQSKDQ